MREKVRGVYKFIQDNLYLCLPDMEVNGEKFNSTLLFEILSCLNNGKQMLFGEYGLGKTTSSELVASIISAMPKEVILASEIRGHPEQTEEKIVARPDLGELNKGNESVIWSYFVLNRTKIIDEFNRLPAAKQNILLDGIDRGNWKYLSELVQTGDFTLFATCNYEDFGNSALIEPVLDRFDIATESKRPSLIQMATIKDIPSATRRMLDDREIADKIFEVYDSKSKSYEEKQKEAEQTSSEYKRKLEQRLGISLLSKDELRKIREEIEKTEFTNEAELFYIFALSELTSCQHSGMKRANEACLKGCHYADYACSKIENGLSVRSALAISKYAKSLAWMAGEKANVEHIEKTLPYAIWHKLKFSEAYLASFAKDERTNPIRLHAAKQLVKSIKQRFTEQMPAVSNYVCLMRDGKEAEAKEYAKDMDHPVFKEMERIAWS